MLLALDTSSRYASVALADEGRVVASRTWHSPVNHTAELMPAVAHLMQSRGLTAGQLDGVAVALGARPRAGVGMRPRRRGAGAWQREPRGAWGCRRYGGWWPYGELLSELTT